MVSTDQHAEQRALVDATYDERAIVALAWEALGTVPDPEVPVISIVELGIVRGVAFDGGRLRVEVTPTYSGCPATELIETMIRERLAASGLRDVDLVRRLSPSWTTDWLAPEGKAKLVAFGIAPPHRVENRIDVAGIGPLRRTDAVVPCPRCASPRTRLLSQFGSTACKAQYRCEDCREPFDYFKPH
ncbi:MAG: phenylacetate-CoA oxygenase subunit PaaJ [Burkholderiales bacterium]|nr:phenylacetate-CoA oxygenase subunit PaaJ [Burkholderiales bacterium]